MTGKITVTLDDVMGDDLSPVMDAKVSFDNDKTTEPDGYECVQLTPHFTREQPVLTSAQKGLIRYLVRGMQRSEYEDILHELADSPSLDRINELLWKWRKTPIHAAPFGHCFLKFTVEAPVFVARQLVKHEYMRMSEVSRRYVNGQPEYYKPDSWRGIAENVKQGAGDFLSNAMQEVADLDYHCAVSVANDTYQDMLVYMAPEEARMVLPLCHMTRWRWSGSLDAVMNACILRMDDHAQSQTREVAMQIGGYVKKAFPQSWASYVEGDI